MSTGYVKTKTKVSRSIQSRLVNLINYCCVVVSLSYSGLVFHFNAYMLAIRLSVMIMHDSL